MSTSYCIAAMRQRFSIPWSAMIAVSLTLIAIGIAGNTGLDSQYRFLSTFLLMAIGLFGIANSARDYTTTQLRIATKRWWLLSVATFIPYGLIATSVSEPAAGTAVPGAITMLTLESIAGAVVCCAAAITVLYGFATFGVHPGQTSPEERILTNEREK